MFKFAFTPLNNAFHRRRLHWIRKHQAFLLGAKGLRLVFQFYLKVLYEQKHGFYQSKTTKEYTHLKKGTLVCIFMFIFVDSFCRLLSLSSADFISLIL